MGIDETYLSLKKDLSGTIQKNRTKQEYLWSLKKIFELYLNEKDFKIIYDYACDIDLITDKLSFYQLKTDKNNNFTIDELIKVPTKKKESILSTLYKLYRSEQTELFIVSNKELCAKNLKNNLKTPVKILSFNNLSDDDQTKIKNHLMNKCDVLYDDINLTKIHFISSDISLIDSDTFCLGETTKFLNNLYGNESGASKLKEFLMHLILERAAFEYSSESIDEIVKYKGLTYSEISQILEDLAVTNKNSDWQICESVKKKLTVKSAILLSKSLKNIKMNGFSNGKIKEYVDYNRKCLDELSDLGVEDFLIEVAKRKDDYLSYEDKLAYCIIAYGKMEG